jgi:hypothetical protein
MGRAIRWILFGILFVAFLGSGRADAGLFGGGEPRTYVIINVAEALGDTSPRYSMLWRRLEADGNFAEYDDETIIEAETNHEDSVVVRGIPGEFLILRVRPGAYALDSVYGTVRESGVTYVASGVVAGPTRPSFEVREGETIYLGIWQVALRDGLAVARPWRLLPSDLSAALSQARNRRLNNAELRETVEREVACTPHRINWRTRRQIC